jgi:hypothetical protein
MHPSRWGKLMTIVERPLEEITGVTTEYLLGYLLELYDEDFRKVNEKRRCVLLVHVWNRDLSASWCRCL